eukprot:960889-Pyramimonas_sp.AAC.1
MEPRPPRSLAAMSTSSSLTVFAEQIRSSGAPRHPSAASTRHWGRRVCAAHPSVLRGPDQSDVGSVGIFSRRTNRAELDPRLANLPFVPEGANLV